MEISYEPDVIVVRAVGTIKELLVFKDYEHFAAWEYGKVHQKEQESDIEEY